MYHPISRLDIRVGKIISIEDNKGGDVLYNEEIDIGHGEIRKVASGLRKLIPKEKLLNQHVIVLCNLPVKTLKGWPSHGMLLCASNGDKTLTEILVPPSGSVPGDLVQIGEYDRHPDKEINPKDNPWDVVKAHLTVNSSAEAVYNESVWKTEKGPVTCHNLPNSFIS